MSEDRSPRARILLDLDGTIVDVHALALDRGLLDHRPCRWDFDACCTRHTMDRVFGEPGIFLNAPPIDGAIDGVHTLMRWFDVWFVSTPWPSNPDSSAEKHLWARRHGWERRLVLAHDKSLIPGVALVDDRPGLVGPWHHIVYPQPWNDGEMPTWADGLAEYLVGRYAS